MKDSASDISPTLDEFRSLAASRRVVSVHRRLLVDTETVVGLTARLTGHRPGTFCFESAERAGVWSRWSFIGVNSVATLSELDGQAHWTGNVPAGLPTDGDPLQVLGEVLRALHTERDPDLPPFTSGMVGYLGYDTVRRIEQLPDSNPDVLGVPELVMMLASDLVVIDHHRGEAWLIANAINFDDTDERVDEAWRDAVDRVEQMTAALHTPTASLALPMAQDAPAPVVRRHRTEAQHAEAIRAAIEEIKAGEAFQIVVSQRFEVDTEVDAFDIYRALRLSNPSPYLYLLRMDGFDIVGSSPEALVTVRNGQATTRPIAGSKPRGATAAEDATLEHELATDTKERAEHLMLVDLGRNDLGRVCRPGTVTVTEFADVRRYSHIMHLESTVVGEVAEGRSALEVLMSCFPAGTLSGAPKVRAMEIIDRLETSRRGVYGGVVGYVDFAGDADAAIAIRTGVVKDGVVHVQAGGGIVADSDPVTEEAETVNKAAAVIRAIAVAEARRTMSRGTAPGEHASGEA